MPSSRAAVVSPEAGRYATRLVARLASRAPAALSGDTTLLLIAGGQARVTPDRRVVRLEATADDEATLTKVEDLVGAELLGLAGRHELAVEWWRPDGSVRQPQVPGDRRPAVGPVASRLSRLPISLYRAGFGWLLDHRFLLLTHVGRRTGTPRTTVLKVLRYDATNRTAVVMSRYGRRSEWYLDLQHAPPQRVTIGRDQFAPSARELDVDEAVLVLADYERRHRRMGLVVRVVLSGFVGWRYYGSDAERRRVVSQLPLVELSPASPVFGEIR